MVRTSCFYRQGPRFSPGQGTKILQAVQHGQKKKKSVILSCYYVSAGITGKKTLCGKCYFVGNKCIFSFSACLFK